MYKVRKEVHKAFGPVWCVSSADAIEDYLTPTWESAMWLACDMAQSESETCVRF